MRILVTGGAGFIASHIVEAYLAAGHEVVIVDDLSTGATANVPEGVSLHRVDIRSSALDDIFASFQPEVVNHHAAQASVKVSVADPVGDLAINGGGTANLAALAASHGVRKIIYASSGGTLYGDADSIPVPETADIRPISPYGTSKRVGELYVELARRAENVSTTVLRYGNVYGPRQDPLGEAGVIAIFAARMLNGQQCTIDGDGEQLRDYVYVGDVARANVLALDTADGDVINIATGNGVSVNEVHATLAGLIPSSVDPQHGPPRPGDVRQSVLDISRAQKVLGWQPEVSFEEGQRRTVASLTAG